MPLKPLFQAEQTIVFEGDSLTNRRLPGALDTWPFLRLMNWQITWADALAEWVFCHRPDLRLRFRNAAVGGSNVRGLESRLESVVLPLKPDWVMLTIGNNDPNQGIDTEEFRARLSGYVTRLKETCGARVIAIGGFEPAPTIPDPDRYEPRRPYHAILKELVESTGGHYYNIGRDLREKAEQHYAASTFHTIYSDASHFNALGANIFAMLVLREVRMIDY